MMTKEEAIKHIDAMIINSKIVRGIVPDEYDIKALTMAIEALEKVSVYEQIKWERDEALATLESHGIGLGQEVKLKCSEKPNGSDLISRQAVLDFSIRLDRYDEENGNLHYVLGIEAVMEHVEHLPSANKDYALSVWKIAQKAFKSDLTLREAIDYVQMIEKQEGQYYGK